METQNTTKTTTVKTPNITCGGCADSIKNARGKMEGIIKSRLFARCDCG
ncbi:MAG: hypothetical protein H0W77_12250 [Acidobacteria bacterium]|nr:hypothetical protein [Acidobacteriota bacterium]